MPRAPLPTLNLVERLAAQIAPKWALRRLADKTQLALAGGYSGASKRSQALRNWSTRAADAVSDINPDLDTLRARARDLARNSPIGAGIRLNMVTHAIGTGLSFQSRIDAAALGISEAEAQAWQDNTERRWRLFAESRDCDAAREQNFYALQAEAEYAIIDSGDVGVLMPSVSRPGWPFEFAIQLIEADRICNPEGKTLSRTDEGVTRDAYGAPVTYHVALHHPGARGSVKREWMPIAAFDDTGAPNFLLIFERTRPGQVRGVPLLAPVIEAVKQISRYGEAELQAAVVNAVFAVFMEMDADAFGQLFDDESAEAYFRRASSWNGGIEPGGLENGGKVVNLMPGEKPVTVTPGRPNPVFDAFFNSVAAQIGMAVGLPREVLLMAFTSSYSASKGALLEAYRTFMGRRDRVATRFCQPIFERWLDFEVAAGRILAPGYFADPMLKKAWRGSAWVGDGPGSLDPLKEANAAEKRIAIGISTRAAESVLHDGGDWDLKHRQLAREAQMRRAAGLDDAAPTPSRAPAVARGEAPDDDERDPNGEPENDLPD